MKGHRCFWADDGVTERIESVEGNMIKAVSGYHFHRRQVTHVLKPRKPAPKKERLEFWYAQPSGGYGEHITPIPQTSSSYVRLVQCEPGEVPISKEALAKAFDNTPLSMDHFERMEICDGVWKQLEKLK